MLALHGDLPIGEAAAWGIFAVALTAGVIFSPRAAVAVWKWAKGITFRDVLVTVFILLVLAIMYLAAGAIWAADFVRGRI